MDSRRLVRLFVLTTGLLLACGPVAHCQDPTFAPPNAGGPLLLVPAAEPIAEQPDAPLPSRLPPVDQGSPQGEPGPRADFLSSGPNSFMSNPEVGHLSFRADYHETWFPNEDVPSQGTRLGFVRQELSVLDPLWQDSRNEWAATLKVENELFNTGAFLPNTGQPFPDELWNIRLGVNYRHLFDNDWIGGTSVSVGSASDQPFHSFDEITVGVNAFLRIPRGERDAWLLSLSYSNNSQLPIPIPGVAYLWQPSDQFRANIGLPAQIMYRPTENLTFDLSYMLLTTIHARATYRLAPMLKVYCGYDFNNESYLLADRPDVNDRFFYYDQRLTTGLQWMLSKHTTLDLAGGYSFDRFYFEGQSLTDSHNDRIDVNPGPFASLQLVGRW